ncbi:MAG TPA: hypothetical protein P5548_01165 [Candidatus Moranbacteria bacterium]|nr:hypothetical protein [Candidatus Moranbacteria bacterium]HRZ33501.1 hypothetical protein [Candidatus Moranbacteria bacterium]
MRIIRKPWFMKLGLLFLFIFFTGLPQSCWQLHKENEAKVPDIPREELFKRQQILHKYMEEKVTKAKEKKSRGEVYTVTDYFSDLKDFSRKGKEMGIDGLGTVSGVSELNQISRDSLKTKKDYVALEKAREDYKEFIDPARIPREKAQDELKALGWRGVLKWFLFVYFRFMPFAFMLFVIWASENKDKEKSMFPRPLRFLLMLISYPAVIGYIFIQWVKKKERHYLVEAEYRRTKQNLFTYLSNEEIQKIKEFRENALSLRSWRNQLAEAGLTPRHGLALALIATLLISFIPNLVQAETKAKAKNFLPETAWEQIADQGQHLARMSISSDNQSQKNVGQQDVNSLIVETFNLQVVLSCSINKIQKNLLRLKEFCRQIDHVPIFSVIQCKVKVLNLITE